MGSIERIRNVARRCLATQRQGHDVVVIVSAMSGETNRLLGLAKQITEIPDERELDVIASVQDRLRVICRKLAYLIFTVIIRAVSP